MHISCNGLNDTLFSVAFSFNGVCFMGQRVSTF